MTILHKLGDAVEGKKLYVNSKDFTALIEFQLEVDIMHSVLKQREILHLRL